MHTNRLEYRVAPEVGAREMKNVRAGLARAMTSLDRLEAGLVRMNAPTSGVDFHAPFGGSKASSFGPREQGPAAGDFYRESRTLLISP